ncbi:hypothetical protein ES703_32252 [subsurface metagenome]
MGSVERQVRYVADGLCIIAVVVGRLTGPPTGTDANHALASLVVVPTDLDEIIVAGDRHEGNLGIRTAEVVIAFDQVVRIWIPTRTIINGELCVVAAATETDSNVTRKISRKDVPDVWAFYAVAGTIERRISGVERPLR